MPKQGIPYRWRARAVRYLSIAAVVYLVPLLLFFVLYFAGQSLFGTEAASIALGGVGFCAGIGTAIWVNGLVKRRRLTSFRITGILG